MKTALPAREALEAARDEFLAASTVVWEEIDRLTEEHGTYPGLPQSSALRVREREAWRAYRAALAAAPVSPPDDEYSPAFQDEYQRLWHQEAERSRLLLAAVNEALALPHAEHDVPLCPMCGVLTKAKNDTATSPVSPPNSKRTPSDSNLLELEPAAPPLIEALELALAGLPDPMHPGIPPQFVDRLVAAQIVLMAALGYDDPGNVDMARSTLAARLSEEPKK